ncbi:hypothetical protein SCD_n03046 (plasmid) [Sulfuricella denitrificans skB26]|uniref:Uncharacterized protein n=1 Tax=Sulfuricella denitrificans (strain DSM 22764 / NBRC 105220 / skB26) TaxID=1163617 RepID=S6ABL1_SULDS|nr:hypothetical protein SCD_n03046 [Sulfuricella denitrificans skB26]
MTFKDKIKDHIEEHKPIYISIGFTSLYAFLGILELMYVVSNPLIWWFGVICIGLAVSFTVKMVFYYIFTTAIADGFLKGLTNNRNK